MSVLNIVDPLNSLKQVKCLSVPYILTSISYKSESTKNRPHSLTGFPYTISNERRMLVTEKI